MSIIVPQLVVVATLMASLAFRVDADPCEEIRNAEFVCLDAQSLGFCVQRNGIWVGEKFLECSASFVCDKDLRSCRLPSQCKTYNANRKFNCQNAGKFPHPYSCQYYFECNERRQETCLKCPNNLSYSAKLERCIEKNECSGEPLFECTAEFEISTWPDNDNIFYICKSMANGELEPVLFKCPYGMVFNGHMCVSKKISLTATGTSIAIAEPSGATARPATETTTCSGISLVQDPGNCQGYLFCAHGRWAKFDCPNGTYFNEALQQCAIGSCK